MYICVASILPWLFFGRQKLRRWVKHLTNLREVSVSLLSSLWHHKAGIWANWTLRKWQVNCYSWIYRHLGPPVQINLVFVVLLEFSICSCGHTLSALESVRSSWLAPAVSTWDSWQWRLPETILHWLAIDKCTFISYTFTLWSTD